MHKTAFRLARAALVLVLAFVGYFLFIRASHVDTKLLGNLVIQRPPVQSLRPKPTLAQPVSAATNSEKVIKDSAKTDPAQTGLYEIEWTSASKTPLETGLLLQLLPDTHRARTAFGDDKKMLSGKPQLTGETLSNPAPYSISSIPGAVAKSYAMTTTSTGKSSGYAFTAVFRVGRVAVTEIVETSDKSPSTTAPNAIANAEVALLNREEPGFSLAHTTSPIVASLVWWIVAVLLAAAAYFVPELAVAQLARRRMRHEERERNRARSQYRARGRRAVRRHKAPAWRQTGRR